MAKNPDVPSLRARLGVGLSRNVLVLGFVSLFTDISSEMIVPIRSIFLVSVLGTPAILLGLIEGVAESTASSLKIVSGRLADRLSERKPLILAGYGLSNLIKPFTAFVASWPQALSLIFLDRVGKGIRSSPRDALLADSTAASHRGKAFGFHRAMDTVGASIGPLLTALILALNNNDLRQVFLWTLPPGLISIAVIFFYLHERPTKASLLKVQPPALQPPLSLGKRYWLFIMIATLFAVGNSSDAFLFLRANELLGSTAAVPLVYFGFNLVYAVLATPLGSLSDHVGRVPVLLVSFSTFALVYFGWVGAGAVWQVVVLFLVYAIYAAANEGVSKALVTDLVPKAQRGTGLGWFNGLTGIAALPANLIAGWLWSSYGPAATFAFGSATSLVAVALLIGWYLTYRGK